MFLLIYDESFFFLGKKGDIILYMINLSAIVMPSFYALNKFSVD